uniref:Gag protein n=1 Tax=Drosophila virilis TaxID=7244 RepID=Q6UJ37_DROVI|nr:gag protein [Drosophila virilis]
MSDPNTTPTTHLSAEPAISPGLLSNLSGLLLSPILTMPASMNGLLSISVDSLAPATALSPQALISTASETPAQKGQEQKRAASKETENTVSETTTTSSITAKTTATNTNIESIHIPADAQAQLAHFKRLIAQLELDTTPPTSAADNFTSYYDEHSSSDSIVNIMDSDDAPCTPKPAQPLPMSTFRHHTPTSVVATKTSTQVISPSYAAILAGNAANQKPKNSTCISSSSDSSSNNAPGIGGPGGKITTTATTGASHYKLLHPTGRTANQIRKNNARKSNRQNSAISRLSQQDAQRRNQFANRFTLLSESDFEAPDTHQSQQLPAKTNNLAAAVQAALSPVKQSTTTTTTPTNTRAALTSIHSAIATTAVNATPSNFPDCQQQQQAGAINVSAPAVKHYKPPQICIQHYNQPDQNGIDSVIAKLNGQNPPIIDYGLKLGSPGILRILPKTLETYSKIINVLNLDNSINYNTYQRREERSFRVVVRGIHASTSTDAIRNELTCMGYTIRNVYCPKYKNRSGPGTYQPNIFFVELAPDPAKNRTIFGIKNLCKYVVRFEWPKINGKKLPQCHRCQRFNHTARYCRHPARCVKCGNEHLTQTCVKPANVPATCANCGSDHTANYKGCPLYLDLLQAKLLSLPNSKNISPNVRQPQPKLQRRQKQPQRQQSAQLQLQQQQQQQKQQQVQLQRQLPKPKLINNKNNKKSKQNGGQIGTQPIQNQKLQTSTPAGVPRKSATPITNNNINTANNANNSNPPTVSSSNSLDPRSRWARIQSLQQQQQQQRQLERPDSVQTREQIISRQRQMLENWSIRQQATTANQPVTQQQSTPMQVDVEQRQLLPSPQQQQLYQTPSSNDLQNDILLQMANKQQEQLDGLMGSVLILQQQLQGVLRLGADSTPLAVPWSNSSQ